MGLSYSLSFSSCSLTDRMNGMLKQQLIKLGDGSYKNWRTNLNMGLVIKNPPANAEDARDVGSIPGSARSPGEGNGYPL